MKSKTKFIIFIILVILFTLFFTTKGFGEYAKPQLLRDYITSFGSIAPIIYLLVYIFGSVLGFPGSILSLTGGLAFGALLGTIYTLIGATIGASLAFWIARIMGRDFIRSLLGKRLQEVDIKLEEKGLGIILFFRLIPIFPFNLLNFTFGLSKVKFKDFFIGTAIGIIPGTFAYVYLGSSLTNIFSIKFILAVLLLVALFLMRILLLPRTYKKFKKKVI
ncbi:MAG: TVP38/TMEM64 family protein [Candidatus Nanoarchaeia archaeon]|nr:TVP38/TMEM64 family protein [Candidatus Nanoarchaeia archaeon]